MTPHQEPRHPLYGSVVWLHRMIQLVNLADCDRGTMFFVVTLNRRFVGRTTVDAKLLGHTAMAANGLDQKLLGGLLLTLLGEPKVDRLARLIHCTIEVLSLALDANIGLVHAPDAPHRAQKEYIQRDDAHRYPDLVLDEDKRAAYDAIGADDNLVYGLKDGTAQNVMKVSSIQDMAEGDRMLRDSTVKRIAELVKGEKPFCLTYALMKVHADNWPSEAFKGALVEDCKITRCTADSHLTDNAVAAFHGTPTPLPGNGGWRERGRRVLDPELRETARVRQ